MRARLGGTLKGSWAMTSGRNSHLKTICRSASDKKVSSRLTALKLVSFWGRRGSALFLQRGKAQRELWKKGEAMSRTTARSRPRTRFHRLALSVSKARACDFCARLASSLPTTQRPTEERRMRGKGGCTCVTEEIGFLTKVSGKSGGMGASEAFKAAMSSSSARTALWVSSVPTTLTRALTTALVSSLIASRGANALGVG